jgi:L-ascorbate metabolism protein UlaG (beta-lactamase superfamily)
MKIKWLGWASFQIETGGKIIYLDPFFGEYDKLADLILISHGHADHCDLDKIEKIRKKDTVVLTSKENSSNVFVSEMFKVGKIDVLFLPIGGKFVMDVKEAVLTVKELSPEAVVPMHYGVVDVVSGGNLMHIELEVDIEEFVKGVGKNSDVRVLKHGEVLRF